MNILITGGASGLGEAITRQLVKDGANAVYFTYNHSTASAKSIVNDYANASAIKCDFRKQDELDELCTNIPGFDIDILVHNAYIGSFIGDYFHKTDNANFHSSYVENIVPAIMITQAALIQFRKKKSGHIITILSSVLNEKPPIGASVYFANKSYLRALTKTWAAENSKYNILSNSISPSFMLTNLTSGIDERVIDQIRENQPGKKLMTPEQVAHGVSKLIYQPNNLNGVDLIMNALTDIKKEWR